MIDVIVVTYNAKSVLIRCIESVLATEAGAPFSLCIYDNGSTDGTGDWLAANAHRGFSYTLLGTNLGFSGAANVAGRSAQGEWILFLDDDVEVSPGWIGKLVEGTTVTENVGLVGCRIVDSANRIFFAEGRCGPLRSLRRGEQDRGQGQYIKPSDMIPGTCWLMRKSLFKIVGDFDEKYFPCQFEDFDYCLRVRQAGFQIIYQGMLTLLHWNLYRSGGRKANLANRAYFYQKLGETLNTFPLPDSHIVDKLMSKAIRLIGESEFAAALELCHQVREGYPDLTEPAMEIRALIGLKRFEEAKGLGEALLELNPTNFFVRFKLLRDVPDFARSATPHQDHALLLDALEKKVRSGAALGLL